MRRYIRCAVVFIAVLYMTNACVEYDAEPFMGRTLPRVTGYSTGVTNDWLYMNLKTGEMYNVSKPNKEIKEGEQKGRLDWDLAFCGYRLRTNSGTSGPGKGGAADLGYQGYEKWTNLSQLPEQLAWVTDDSTVAVTMSQNDWNKFLIEHHLDFNQNPWFDPNNGPAKALTNANPLLAEAMSFTGPPPVYAPSFHTYLIRSADGLRFYKFQIVSWYNADVEIGDSGGRISYYLDELR